MTKTFRIDDPLRGTNRKKKTISLEHPSSTLYSKFDHYSVHSSSRIPIAVAEIIGVFVLLRCFFTDEFFQWQCHKTNGAFKQFTVDLKALWELYRCARIMEHHAELYIDLEKHLAYNRRREESFMGFQDGGIGPTGNCLRAKTHHMGHMHVHEMWQ